MRYLNVNVTKESIRKERYLPVAIDPGKKICGVVIMHTEANNHSIIKSLEIENCSLKDVEALIREAEEAAGRFACKPIFVFEATSILWRPLFAYLEASGYLCHQNCRWKPLKERIFIFKIVGKIPILAD